MLQLLVARVNSAYEAQGVAPPAIGTDELLPLVEYVLRRTRAPGLASQLVIVAELLADDPRMMHEDGFALANLEAALEAISTLPVLSAADVRTVENKDEGPPPDYPGLS